MESEDAERNKIFYEKSYGGANIVRLVGLFMLSFDQMSKTKRNLRAIEEHRPKDDCMREVCEFGFGYGTLLLRMPRTYNLTGVELASSAHKNIKRLSSLMGRSVRTFFPDELSSLSHRQKYDWIMCSHVLEHVDDDDYLLEKFSEILKPQGKILINLPINEVWDDPNHQRSYSEMSAVELLRRHKFNVLSLRKEDKLSGFFLSHLSQREHTSRVLRVLLALCPVDVWDFIDRAILASHAHQQLIIVAEKMP